MRMNQRLNLINISMLVILMLLVAGYVNFTVRGVFEGNMEERELTCAEQVAEEVMNPLLNNDSAIIQQVIDDIKMRNTDIRYVYVVGYDGAVVAHTFTQGFPVDLVTANPIPSGKSRSIRILSFEGESVRDIGVRIADGMDAKVYFGFSREPILNSMNTITNTIVGIFAFIILISVFVSFFVTRTVTRPLEQLVEGTKRIGKGELDYKIDVMGADEIQTLAKNFNQMAEDLKISEAKYCSVAESVDDMIYLVDDDLRFLACNRKTLECMRVSAGDIVGKPLIEVIRDPAEKEFYQKKLQRIFENGKSETHEQEYTISGEKRYYSMTMTPVFDAEGNVAAVACVGCDITDLKRTEEALRKEKYFSETLIQSSPTFFVAVNSSCKIIMINKAMLQALGYTADEVVGTDYLTTFVPEYEREMLIRTLGEIYSKKSTFNENHVLTRDGRELLIEWYGVPILKENNELDFYFAVGVDITRRRLVEEERRKYAEELKRSNELKDLFTDILRHDLLNPASIVKGYTELLLDVEEDEKKLKSLKAIERNNQKLIGMIETASKFAKLESVEELEFREMDIGSIFKGVIENFKSTLEEKQIMIEFAAEGSYPSKVNPVFEEVFANLLSNAIKYSPEKSRIIIDIMDAGENWKVLVTDFGVGISDDDKPKLFERFKRVEKGTVKGTGLGLAIVKRLIDLHGGTVGIEDNPAGQGSVFWVTVKKA